MQDNNIKKSIITAVCVALCVVFPLAFHAIPDGGRLFSPMHVPVFLCGFICGPVFGLICGILGPLLSSVLTSMPPAFILPGMMVELAAYGLIAGLVFTFVRSGKTLTDLLIALVAAMVGGRIIAGLANALIFQAGEYSMDAWLGSYIIGAWPAIVMHLVLLPVIYLILEKSSLIERRYAKS